MNIANDYNLSYADLGNSTQVVQGYTWKVSKTHPKTDKSCAVASTTVNGVTIRLDIPDQSKVGYLYIGRTNVESLIIDTENIEDAEVRELVETGYLAMRAALDAAMVQQQQEAEEKKTRRETREAAERAAAAAIRRNWRQGRSQSPRS
jgi:hypothetical protein